MTNLLLRKSQLMTNLIREGSQEILGSTIFSINFSINGDNANISCWLGLLVFHKRFHSVLIFEAD